VDSTVAVYARGEVADAEWKGPGDYPGAAEEKVDKIVLPDENGEEEVGGCEGGEDRAKIGAVEIGRAVMMQ
jgi:hypothetical protein